MNSIYSVKDLIISTRKGVTPKYVDESDVIVLNQKCIRNNRIDYTLAQYHDPGKKFSDDKKVMAGDILINSTGQGTAGRCAFVKELPSNKTVITDSHVLIVRTSEFYTAGCLEYSLFSIESLLQSFMDGSTGQGEFDKQRLFTVHTALPLEGNREKTFNFLNDIDKKVEINSCINAELEFTAKTLYDYWFVQFDFPDVNGKPYKSSGGKMFYNAELKREIPEGWVSGRRYSEQEKNRILGRRYSIFYSYGF
jgi:type I restriction enzyme S subunit